MRQSSGRWVVQMLKALSQHVHQPMPPLLERLEGHVARGEAAPWGDIRTYGEARLGGG